MGSEMCIRDSISQTMANAVLEGRQGEDAETVEAAETAKEEE